MICDLPKMIIVDSPIIDTDDIVSIENYYPISSMLKSFLRFIRTKMDDWVIPPSSSLSSLVYRVKSWWRHQMETIFRVTGPLCGEFTGHGEFPSQRPVKRSFDVFFDMCFNKRLSKQSWGWSFETPSRPLWRHCKTHGIITRYGANYNFMAISPFNNC